MTSVERSAQLESALAAVRARIADACRSAGRTDDVTLIVVTKTYPVADALALADLGVRDMGENRHPEAQDKAEALAQHPHHPRLHFLGHLQTNKAGAVGRYADLVHSLDRAKLARSLARAAGAAGRELSVLVQVDFDGRDPGRSGALPEAVEELADLVGNLEGLRLEGLMTVAPLDVEPRRVFGQLRELSERVRTQHPTASMISAGMSGDLEAAVAEGATHLRVGRAVLGERV